MAGRHQTVLELCEMVLANDPKNRPARQMKITSIDGLKHLRKILQKFLSVTRAISFLSRPRINPDSLPGRFVKKHVESSYNFSTKIPKN